MTYSQKRERFRRVAARRVQAIINKLSSLSNCANTYNYEYTEQEIFIMFKTIKEKIKLLFSSKKDKKIPINHLLNL